MASVWIAQFILDHVPDHVNHAPQTMAPSSCKHSTTKHMQKIVPFID